MKVKLINVGNGVFDGIEEVNLNVGTVEEVFEYVMRRQEEESKKFYTQGLFKIIAHIEDDDGNVLYSIGDYGIRTMRKMDVTYVKRYTAYYTDYIDGCGVGIDAGEYHTLEEAIEAIKHIEANAPADFTVYDRELGKVVYHVP